MYKMPNILYMFKKIKLPVNEKLSWLSFINNVMTNWQILCQVFCVYLYFNQNIWIGLQGVHVL